MNRSIIITLALIAAIAVSSCASSGWAWGLSMLGFGQSAVPENLISYVRSDYTENSDITISGGDTFNVTCVNGLYPRATDDPAAGITTEAVTYNWSIQTTASNNASVYVNIGGTIIASGEYESVGTYTGQVTTGTTGYIRIGANCDEASSTISYKLVLTPL